MGAGVGFAGLGGEGGVAGRSVGGNVDKIR